MKGSLLGQVLATALPRGDMVVSACLPRSVPGSLLDQLVLAANDDLSGVPYAVRVVREEQDPKNPLHVLAARALEYRAGSRLLAWREGEFDPDWSFGSTVEMLVHPEFPARVHPHLGLAKLAQVVVSLLPVPKDVIVGTDWGILQDSIHHVLCFLRDALQCAGNRDIAWPAAWWECTALYLDTLEKVVSGAKPGQLSLSAFAYAAAGLPVPDSGGATYLQLTAKRYAAAVDDRWSSTSLAQETLDWMQAQLNRVPPLRALPWLDYQDALHSSHPVLALSGLGDMDPVRYAAWSATTESDFLGVAGDRPGRLDIYVDGQSLPQPGSSDIFVLPMERIEVEGGSTDDECILCIHEVDIVVPARVGTCPDMDDSAHISALTATVTIGGGWKFIVDTASIEAHALHIRGMVQYVARSGKSWPDRAQSVSVTRHPSWQGNFDADARARLVLPCPWAPCAIVAWGGGKKQVGISGGGKMLVSGVVIGPTEPPKPYVLKLDMEEAGHILIYDGRQAAAGGSPLDRVIVGGTIVEEDVTSPWPVFQTTGIVTLADAMQVVAEEGQRGHELLEVSVESGKPRPWLPLAATALDIGPELGAPRADMETGVCGRLEELLSRAVDRLAASTKEDLPPSGGLWQCALPVGSSHQFEPAELDQGDALKWYSFVQAEVRDLDHVGTGPSAELLSSHEAAEFWDALRDLTGKINSRNVLVRPWPCRWQLKDVPEAFVERYLNCYANLVRLADGLGRGDRFWASYPFSIFFYDLDNRRLAGVALSPLHPVRLAWLYGCERAVARDGRPRAHLVQVAEGWNMPWVGPAPAPVGSSALMAAIPIDPGPEHLFLGWSMLVRFDNSQGSGLALPVRAAGMSVPGGSASGLNEGGVGAALRDFLRIYPHLSTISVDLFASTKGSRSTELDRALISEFAQATREDEVAARLPGGLRVFDSLNREGTPPRRDIAIEMLAKTRGEPLPLSWRRYDPLANESPRCDLRLVEDAQARIARVPGTPLGAVTRWPLRRLVIHDFPSENGDAVHVDLCIDPETRDGWTPFLRALAVLEQCGGLIAPALQVNPGSALRATRSGASWIVTGSLYLDPGALAQAVSTPAPGQIDSRRMLWEWRPAHLSSRLDRAVSRFERRPYTTIATIPRAFEEALRERLGSSLELTRAVFSELGRRGVGLASLLAIGGNHALGALGFFLGYRLVDCGQTSGVYYRVVVPMDAVEPLLREIAGESSEDFPKRADLLVLEIRPGDPLTLVFLPVEIKCYGFDSATPPSALPNVESRDVKSALVQVEHSLVVLAGVVDALREALATGDASLECAALGAVVESALLFAGRTVPVNVGTRALQEVALGRAIIGVARGLLLWFQDTPNPGESRPELEADTKGILFVDPALEVDDWLSGTPMSASKEAADVIDWCLSSFTACLEQKPGTRDNRPPQSHGSWAEPASEMQEKPGRDNAEGPTPTDNEKSESPDGDPQPPTPTSADNDGPGSRVNYDDPSVPNGPVPVPRPIVFLGGQRDGRDEVTWDPYNPKRLNNSHVVILGASGAGKTQVTKSFIHELSKQDVPSLIFDFKDDYVDPEFLESIGGRMLEADDGLPVNPLALVPDPLTKKVKVQNKVYEVAGILRKVYGLGDQQEANLRTAIFSTYEAAGFPLRGAIQVNTVAPSFQDVYPHLVAQGDPMLVNRLSPIFDLQLFTGDADSLLDYLRGPTVIRLALLPTEEVKKATADIVLMSLYSTLLRLGQCHGLRLAVVVDEAHKIANLRAMRLLLKEARAYGAAIILSSQEARDFEDTVFSNAGSLLVLKLSETRDSERVAGLLGGSVGAKSLAERIRGLAQFHGLFRNDHYQPFREVTVLPHFKRMSE